MDEVGPKAETLGEPMTPDAKRLLSWLQSRADRSGRGTVLLSDADKLCGGSGDKRLAECENAKELFEVSVRGGVVSYRVERD